MPTALIQDILDLAYPIPMDEDTVDSRTSSTINTNNSEAVSETRKTTAPSNASVTTTKASHVHLSMPSDLASPKDAQNSQNISVLKESAHKNDKPADIYDARLLNVTPGEFLFFFLFQNVFSVLFHGAVMSHTQPTIARFHVMS